MSYRNCGLVSVLFVCFAVSAPGEPGVDRTSELIAVLQSDAGLEAKIAACRDLASVGDGRAVPVLASLLDNPELAHMARHALEPMPGEAADTAFRAALTKVTGDLLIGVIDSIGVRRDADAVSLLGPLLRHGQTGVADAAAAALGRIATPPAANALAAQLAGGAADRPAVVDACLLCAQGLAEDGKRDQAIQLYDAMRQRELLPHHAMAAARGAIVVREADGLPLLVALLQNADADLRGLAMGLARELPGDGVATALSAKLPDLETTVQAQLITALADRGDPAVVTGLLPATKSASAAVRIAAITALGRVGDATAIGPLTDAAANEERPDESAAALTALGMLQAPGVSAAIVDVLGKAEPGLRAKLITLLADRDAKESVPRLLEEAASTDPEVSAAALSALAELGRPGDLPALVSLLLNCTDDATRQTALRAIGAVAAGDPNIAGRGTVIVERLGVTQDSAKRIVLLRALAAVGNFQAFAALRAALEDADAGVRDVALRGLTGWTDATPTSLLLRVAGQTENQVHRVLALRAVLRMAGMIAADCATPSEQVIEWFLGVNEMVRGPDEAKLLLSGLTNLKHPAALDMASARLDDPGVRAEAALAVLAAAPVAAAAGSRDAARTALEKVIATVADAEIKERATAALKGLAGGTEYILDWQVCGPYTQKGKECQQLYPIVFPPEKSQDNVAWRALPRTGGKTGQLADVGATLPGSHRAAYVRTWLVSEEQQPAKLEFGFDDGGKVWLNNEVVCEANTAGACIPGQHKADVTLREGRNLLFLKVTQHTGPWQFSARLVGSDGKPLKDVEVMLATVATGTPAAPPAIGTSPNDDIDFSQIPAVSLFDGKTLDGWEGAPGCFVARDGAIVGGQLEKPITVSDYLCTTREFADFELTTEVRMLGKRTNGGIQFRGARVPDSHAMTGFQADVCDGLYWGCLYDCARRGFAIRVPQQELTGVLRLSDWNEYRIRAVGNRIQIWLNGYRTLDYTETDPKIPTKGLIGLQSHQGPPGEGWYRNMLIREVK